MSLHIALGLTSRRQQTPPPHGRGHQLGRTLLAPAVRGVFVALNVDSHQLTALRSTPLATWRVTSSAHPSAQHRAAPAVPAYPNRGLRTLVGLVGSWEAATPLLEPRPSPREELRLLD